MKLDTLNKLVEWIGNVTASTCHCTVAEKHSGHREDCRYLEVEAKATELVDALNTDETIVG